MYNWDSFTLLKDKPLYFLIKHRYALLLLLFSLCLFHSINNYVVISHDNLPFIFDSRIHYEMAVKMYRGLKSFNKLNFIQKIDTIFQRKALYPFLRYWLTVPFFLLFGVSPKAALFSNLLYYFILIYAIYGIGKILKDRFTGFLASFLVSFYPCVFGFSRVYMLDFPITALVALSIYIMLKSNYLQNKKYVFWLGISLTIGMLHKQTFIIYFVGPFLIYLFQTILKFKRLKIINIVHIFIVPLILILPWYLDGLAEQICLMRQSFHQFSFTTFDKLNILFYKNLKDYQLYPILTYLFYLSLFVYLFIKSNYKSILLTWLLTPFLYVFFFYYEDLPRHTMPGLIASGLIISLVLNIFFSFIQKRNLHNFLKPLIVCTIFITCVIQFYIICCRKTNELVSEIFLQKRFHQEGMLYPAEFKHRDIDDAITFIKQTCLTMEGNKKCMIGISYLTLFTELIAFKSLDEDWPIKLIHIDISSNLKESLDKKLEINFRPDNFDYLLTIVPLESYVDEILLLQKYTPLRFHYFLESFALRIKKKLKILGRDRKLSNEEIKKLLIVFCLDVQNNSSTFQLIKKIDLPPYIFKLPPLKNYYLYKKKTH